jgi:hypothetical protein
MGTATESTQLPGTYIFNSSICNLLKVNIYKYILYSIYYAWIDRFELKHTCGSVEACKYFAIK